MKADEWKNWTLIYSLFCLKNLIPEAHWVMWSVFLSACILICKRCVTEKLLMNATNVSGFLHLKECMIDYGPVYAFWCFSYEMFNGILVKFHINNHSVSITMM